MFISLGQEIRYDTTYRVTYENGIKDSVIIIYKRIIFTEKVYIIDSSSNNRWAYDFFACPFFTNLNTTASSYSSFELSNTNSITSNFGQSIGSHIYYNHSKNIEFRGGINCSSNKVNMHSDKITQSKVTSTYLVNDTLDVYYSIDNQNDTTYFYIIEQKPQTITDIITNHQSNNASLNIYFFQMTLQAGYKKQFKNFSLCLFGGLSSTFLLTAKGNVLNDKGEIINASEARISSPLIHGQTNIQVSYNLKNKTQLYIEPYFQKYLFSLNNVKTSVYNKDSSGIRVGIKFSI
jgi:hypothetical protein